MLIIDVDPGVPRGPIPKLMADIGFDEIRAILDPLGQSVFDMIKQGNTHAVMRTRSATRYPRLEGSREFREFPMHCFRYVRCHNMFTGDGGDRQAQKNAGLVDVRWDRDGLHTVSTATTCISSMTGNRLVAIAASRRACPLTRR